MVALRGVELVQRSHLGHDRVAENVSFVDLLDVGLGNALLLLVDVEDGAAVLGAGVGTLAVERGGVVGDLKKILSSWP